MILRAATAAAAFALVTFISFPARADVLEVGAGGEVRWVSGPRVVGSGVVEAVVGGSPVVGEVPSEALVVPDYAVADASRHASWVPADYAAKVLELSERFDLSPALIEAVVWQESRWRADAVSPAGARGLAQLMPGTARELGVDASDPYANLEGGARYLRAQLDRFGGDLEKALAAYNAGPGRVERAGGVPQIRETQGYVASVLGRLSNHSRKAE